MSAALDAAKARVQGRVLTGWQELEEGLAAACDPALGNDRLVCLHDVIAFVCDYSNRLGRPPHAAEFEREFGRFASPTHPEEQR